jgi:hypothetical protein
MLNCNLYQKRGQKHSEHRQVASKTCSTALNRSEPQAEARALHTIKLEARPETSSSVYILTNILKSNSSIRRVVPTKQGPRRVHCMLPQQYNINYMHRGQTENTAVRHIQATDGAKKYNGHGTPVAC